MVIPGSVYNRFLHRTPEPKPVVGRLIEEKGQSLEGNPLVRYEIYFPEDDRTFSPGTRVPIACAVVKIFGNMSTGLPSDPCARGLRAIKDL